MKRAPELCQFYDGSAALVSSKVRVPPLLRQRHNAALGLLYKSSFDPRSNLSLTTQD